MALPSTAMTPAMSHWLRAPACTSTPSALGRRATPSLSPSLNPTSLDRPYLDPTLKSSSSVLTLGPPAYETSFFAYETSLPTALTSPAAGQRGPSWNMHHCCAAVFLDSPLSLPPCVSRSPCLLPCAPYLEVLLLSVDPGATAAWPGTLSNQLVLHLQQQYMGGLQRSLGK